jgi:3-methyl-2-oxobutanoate hydroxymethyltransferase
MKEEMQRERVAGFREFVDDVRTGRFPGPEHVIKTSGGLIEDFTAALEKLAERKV